jgi:endonuclease/exonuclease/phosphatase family metal-dependent hydrolase
MPKLISWNIASRINVRSEQLAWIESENVDVLALQEVARAADLRQRLSDLGFKYFASTEPMDGRKGGPNCFDHMIATASIMPCRIRLAADKVTPKLSDHAALVAEWQVVAQ